MHIFTEGDLDRVIIEDILNIIQKRGNVYPKKVEKEKEEKDGIYWGEDSAISAFLHEIRRASETVLVLDLDKKTPNSRLKEIKKRILSEFTIIEQRENKLKIKTQQGEAEARIIFAGLRDDVFIKQFGITKHEMEDYLLKILLEDSIVYNILKEEKFDEKEISVTECVKKIKIFVKHLQKQNLTISSKKVFNLFRAVMGFHAAPATLAGTILKNTPLGRKEKIFENIITLFK